MKLRELIFTSLLCCLTLACGEAEPALGPSEELPVSFEMLYPASGTRASADPDNLFPVAEKTAFAPGDVIHVSGVFELEGGATETRYGHLSLQPSGIWAATGSETPITWPVEAVSGTFTAFYMPTSNGPILVGNPMELPLGGDFGLSDPLQGVSTSQPYGHAVPVLFGHLTSRLVLTDAQEDQDEYWMVEKVGSAQRISNSYRLSHNADNSLSFEFLCNTDLNEGTVSATKDPDFEDRVSFHLAPGNYDGVCVNFRGNQPYLSLNINDLRDLRAGDSYAVSISGTPGVVQMVDAPDPWTEDPDPLVFDSIFDINKFIESINNNREYILDDGTEVLTKTKAGSLVLMRDISFSNLMGFIELNIPSAVVLNGDDHFIKDFRQPLFRRIDGKLLNLGISNVEIDYSGASSFVGALALELYSNAVVDNVLLDDVRVRVRVDESSTTNSQAGALIGYSQGVVSDVLLRGEIEVSARNADGLAQADETLFLGGVVGQMAGTLTGIRQESGSVLTVSSESVGRGVSYLGGAAGYIAESCLLSDCSLDVTVDNSQSIGFISYVGGASGRLAGAMEGCNVSGTVRGGNVVNLNSATVSLATTGGLVGNITNNSTVSLTYCNTTASVQGHPGFSGVAGTFGIKAFTGGAVGLSYCQASQVGDCVSWGAVSGSGSNVENHIGSFIGGTTATASAMMSNGNQAIGTPFAGIENFEIVGN